MIQVIGNVCHCPICESRGVFFFFFRCECQVLIGGLMTFYVFAIILLFTVYTVYVMLSYIIYYLYMIIGDYYEYWAWTPLPPWAAYAICERSHI